MRITSLIPRPPAATTTSPASCSVAALMISAAGDPLRICLSTCGPQSSKTAATASTARCAASRKLPPPSPTSWCSASEISSAKATEASGRSTATTEIAVIFAGSAKDVRWRAAASDCGDPSVATTTCISGVPPGDGLGIAAPGTRGPVPRAGGVLDEEEDDADGDEPGAPEQRRRVVVDGEPEDGQVAEQPEDQQGCVGPVGALVLVPPAQLQAGDDHEGVDGQEEHDRDRGEGVDQVDAAGTDEDADRKSVV